MKKNALSIRLLLILLIGCLVFPGCMALSFTPRDTITLDGIRIAFGSNGYPTDWNALLAPADAPQFYDGELMRPYQLSMRALCVMPLEISIPSSAYSAPQPGSSIKLGIGVRTAQPDTPYHFFQFADVEPTENGVSASFIPAHYADILLPGGEQVSRTRQPDTYEIALALFECQEYFEPGDPVRILHIGSLEQDEPAFSDEDAALLVRRLKRHYADLLPAPEEAPLDVYVVGNPYGLDYVFTAKNSLSPDAPDKPCIYVYKRLFADGQLTPHPSADAPDAFGLRPSLYSQAVQTEDLAYLIYRQPASALGSAAEKAVLAVAERESARTNYLDPFTGQLLCVLDANSGALIEDNCDYFDDQPDFKFSQRMELREYYVHAALRRMRALGVSALWRQEDLYRDMLLRFVSSERVALAERLRADSAPDSALARAIASENVLQRLASVDDPDGELTQSHTTLFYLAEVLAARQLSDMAALEELAGAHFDKHLARESTTLLELQAFYLLQVPETSRHKPALEGGRTPWAYALESWKLENELDDQLIGASLIDAAKSALEGAWDEFGVSVVEREQYYFMFTQQPGGDWALSTVSAHTGAISPLGSGIDARYVQVSGVSKGFLTLRAIDGAAAQNPPGYAHMNLTPVWEIIGNRPLYWEVPAYHRAIPLYAEHYLRWGLDNRCEFPYVIPMDERLSDVLGSLLPMRDDPADAPDMSTAAGILDGLLKSQNGVLAGESRNAYFLSVQGMQNLYKRLIPASGWYFTDTHLSIDPPSGVALSSGAHDTEPASLADGSAAIIEVFNLDPNSVYLAVRARDEAGNAIPYSHDVALTAYDTFTGTPLFTQRKGSYGQGNIITEMSQELVAALEAGGYTINEFVYMLEIRLSAERMTSPLRRIAGDLALAQTAGDLRRALELLPSIYVCALPEGS